MSGLTHSQLLMAQKKMIREERIGDLVVHGLVIVFMILLSMGFMWNQSSNNPDFGVRLVLGLAALGVAVGFTVFARQNWKSFIIYEKSLC